MALASVKRASQRTTLGVLGASAFFALLGALDAMTRGSLHLPALLPPFGASVAIVFFSPESPMGRPWPVLVGHFVSICTASLALWLLPSSMAVTTVACIAVPLAIVAMLLTRSFHPPGGASALFAVLFEPKLSAAWLCLPVMLGAGLLVTLRVALDYVAGRALELPRRRS